MGQSILVFVSHSSEDKECLIEPIVTDLEDCFINVWLDKRKIVPGDNLRKSIFRDGLDKADIVLIFFTEKSLKSSWVDKEIKHVLREENRKGNNFDLNKIISIFDSQTTYEQITERYPELTDDLLHLMPIDYSKIQFGQLLSAIWSKYLSLQGGDVETQRQLLAKDKEIFQKEKENQELKSQIKTLKSNSSNTSQNMEFERFVESGKIDDLLNQRDKFLLNTWVEKREINNVAEALAFELISVSSINNQLVSATVKAKELFKWYILEGEKNKNKQS